MLFLKRNKDGGLLSNTIAYWLFEIKPFASIGLLKFEGKSREVYHNHAFDCIGFVLKGKLTEERIGLPNRVFTPKVGFFIIKKEDQHKVSSNGVTWCFTIRGKWDKTWKEKHRDREITLTNGRVVTEEDFEGGYANNS